MSAYDERYLSHWADHAARRTIAAHPHRRQVAVAAGITPSGVVHVGNFREVITVDLVARALRDRGLDVRFLYSWDDFDVFRKVPKDMPQPDMLAEHLGRSIVDVPDPFGEHDSYASHNIAAFEQSMEPLGIQPEFIRQHARYRAGAYAEGIRAALIATDTIRGILNEARRANDAKRLLDDNWTPLSGFCEACGKDDVALSWDGEWSVHVICNGCSHESDVDLREGGNIKLPWRVDWPMRWDHEKVCFEPGGKDHSSAGGSYDTARQIVKQVYGWAAPEYVGYDFVGIKGTGGKISSSRGGVVTVADCLEVYEPDVLRWLFASYRPNTEFQISFDLDVIKTYEDHDRQVRLAHAADDGGKADKKRQAARRTLHLASVDHQRIEPGTPAPFLPSFRPLSLVLQIFDGDIAGARTHYHTTGQLAADDPAGNARFESRAIRVWNWVERYAPDEFRYRIRTQARTRQLDASHTPLLRSLCDKLRANPDLSDAEAGAFFKELSASSEIPLKAFYPVVYDLLIGRDHGPKLSTLLATMGGRRALPLLEASLRT